MGIITTDPFPRACAQARVAHSLMGGSAVSRVSKTMQPHEAGRGTVYARVMTDPCVLPLCQVKLRGGMCNV